MRHTFNQWLAVLTAVTQLVSCERKLFYVDDIGLQNQTLHLFNITGINQTFIDDSCTAISQGYHCAYPFPVWIEHDNLSVLCIRVELEFETLYEIVVDGNRTSCVECYMNHHCLANNTCSERSAGPTCERCSRKTDGAAYYEVGNWCTHCSLYYVLPLVFSFIFLIYIICGLVHFKFTISCATKVKLLIHFVQLTQVTSYTSFQFPDYFAKVLSFFRISELDFKILLLECYTDVDSWRTYIHWNSLALTFILVLIILKLGDGHLVTLLKHETDWDLCDTYHAYRVKFRRFMYFWVIWFYMPISIAALHTQSCEQVVPSQWSLSDSSINDAYLRDQDLSNISCYSPMFQISNFVLSILFILLGICFPCAVAFMGIAIYYWDNFSKYRFSFGGIYEAFKPKYAFWESLIMLRKFVCVLVSGIFPIRPLASMCVYLLTTAVYLLLIVFLRPYMKFSWDFQCRNRSLDIHNTFEIIANSALLLFQIDCLVHVTEGHDPEESSILDFITLSMLVAIYALWVVMFCCISKEINTPNEIDSEMFPEDHDNKVNLHDLWTRFGIIEEFAILGNVRHEEDDDDEQLQSRSHLLTSAS